MSQVAVGCKFRGDVGQWEKSESKIAVDCKCRDRRGTVGED